MVEEIGRYRHTLLSLTHTQILVPNDLLPGDWSPLEMLCNHVKEKSHMDLGGQGGAMVGEKIESDFG